MALDQMRRSLEPDPRRDLLYIAPHPSIPRPNGFRRFFTRRYTSGSDDVKIVLTKEAFDDLPIVQCGKKNLVLSCSRKLTYARYGYHYMFTLSRKYHTE